MYELVNTSVPNGLMPGTHGFATVAMTKGMPDVIRTRVENFCAYPHRTSAHDQSYYSQNPVNWFHLMLPNGDHVLGRTAPTEFDYTGRTNRLARTLYFSAAEMPRVSGAYVLALEAPRLCAPWSGEPHYLPEDKQIARRLRLTGSRVGAESSYWQQMFGAKGAEYAKRFAALLAKNIRGGNKCIYFKAGAADIDGTRLLGLFSDLINQLPEELAAQVAFSTFAACVPGGVACHLRGVFDKDQAFEANAALSPWVDCETGCVRHEELLPKEEIVIRPFVSEVRSRAADLPRVEKPIERNRFAQSVANTRRAEMFTPSAKSDPFVKWLGIGSGVLILILVALFLSVWQPRGKGIKTGKDDHQIERLMHEDLEEWYSEKIAHLNEVEQKIEECTTSAAAQALKVTEEAMMNGLKDELEEKGLTGYEEKLEDVKARSMRLLERLDRKIEELKAQEKENRKAAAQEKEREEQTRQKPEGQPEKAEASAKQPKEKKEEEGKEGLSIKDLPPITKEFSHAKSWDKTVTDTEKSSLTNAGSIIFFYPDGRDEVEFKCKWGLVSKNKKPKLTAPEPKDGSKKSWVIVYIPSLQKVYWQWRSVDKVKVGDKFFKEQDKIDLSELVFGRDKDAAELYKKFHNQYLVYILSRKEGYDVKPYHYTTKEEVSIDRYAPKPEVLENLENRKKRDEDGLKEIEKKLDEAGNDEKTMKGYISTYTKLTNEYNKVEKDDERKDEKKTKKDKIAGEKDKLQKDAKSLLVKYEVRSQNLSEVTEEDITTAVNKKRRPLETKQKKLKQSVGKREQEIKNVKNWRDVIRDQDYILEILVGDAPSSLPKAIQKDIKNHKEVDHLTQEIDYSHREDKKVPSKNEEEE